MNDKLTVLYHFYNARCLMSSIQSSLDLYGHQEKGIKAFRKNVLMKSPFYREFADKPLSEFPIMDKATMLANFNDINTAGIGYDQAMQTALDSERSRDFSPEISGVTVGLSSGTSGRRGLFLASKQERLKWAGIMLAKALPRSILKPHRIAFFLRANSNLYSTLNTGKQLKLDFYDITYGVDHSFEALNATQPEILTAPASVLRRLAEATLKGQVKITPLRIFSVAEVLDEDDKAYIASAFNKEVHQIYQCTEGFLGISDFNGRLRLNEEYVHIEKEWIDKKNGRFVPIITDFTRSTQPIVRYRLDDVLIEDLKDGTPFTVLKAIEGRCDDVCYLQNTEGEPVPLYADTLRQAISASSMPYDKYRIIQHSMDDFELQFEPYLISEFHHRVGEVFASMASRHGCKAPNIRISAFEKPADGDKFRRIICKI